MIGKEAEIAYLKNAGLNYVDLAEFYKVDSDSVVNFVRLYVKDKHELNEPRGKDAVMMAAIHGFLNASSDEIKEVISKKVLSRFIDDVLDETKYVLATREGKNGLFRAIIQDEPYSFEFSNEHLLNTLVDYITKSDDRKEIIRNAALIVAEESVRSKYGNSVDDYVNEILQGVQLEDRERFVLEGRYGINEKKRTQKDIGAELKLNKARIGQIEAKALRKVLYHKARSPDVFLKYFSNFIFDIDLTKIEAKNRPFNYQEEEKSYGRPFFEKRFDLLMQTLGILVPENERTPEAIKPLLEELIEISPRGKELSKEQKILLTLVYTKNLNYKEAQDTLVFGHSFNLTKIFNSALDWILTTENLAHFYHTKLESIPKEHEMYAVYRKAYVTAYEEFKAYAIYVLEEIANMTSTINKNIKNLDLSVRATRCLQNIGVETLKQLSQMTETELRKSRNLGEKTFEELKLILKNNGLSLK